MKKSLIELENNAMLLLIQTKLNTEDPCSVAGVLAGRGVGIRSRYYLCKLKLMSPSNQTQVQGLLEIPAEFRHD